MNAMVKAKEILSYIGIGISLFGVGCAIGIYAMWRALRKPTEPTLHTEYNLQTELELNSLECRAEEFRDKLADYKERLSKRRSEFGSSE